MTSQTLFTGYAAIFHEADYGGDIILPGAFADTSWPVPLLRQHDPDKQIGTVRQGLEDRNGLLIEGIADDANIGSGTALSFGYRAKEQQRLGKNRYLHRIELIEVSVVTNPMQRKAMIEHVEPYHGEVRSVGVLA